MSRVGKKPIKIDEGISIEISSDKIKATFGDKIMEVEIPAEISVEKHNNEIIVGRKVESIRSRSFHGLIARMIQNMIKGIKDNFTKVLIFTGTGYRVAVDRDIVKLNMGYSHEINLNIPSDLTVVVKKNNILVTGSDKQKVGQFAAKIREVRLPEVYKGKGIRYENEIIKRKAGKKTAA